VINESRGKIISASQNVVTKISTEIEIQIGIFEIESLDGENWSIISRGLMRTPVELI